MANIFGFFGSILGYVLWAAFYFLKDFGLSIVVFTIVIRLICSHLLSSNKIYGRHNEAAKKAKRASGKIR